MAKVADEKESGGGRKGRYIGKSGKQKPLIRKNRENEKKSLDFLRSFGIIENGNRRSDEEG